MLLCAGRRSSTDICLNDSFLLRGRSEKCSHVWGVMAEELMGVLIAFSIGEPAVSQIRCFQQLYLSSERRAPSGRRSLSTALHQLDLIWVNHRSCRGPVAKNLGPFWLSIHWHAWRNVCGKGNTHFLSWKLTKTKMYDSVKKWSWQKHKKQC